MIRFMSFSSGSCGNCYYLGNEEKGILIDAGVSLRRLKKYMSEVSLSFDAVKAILVTHDHMDHVRHLASYCIKLNKPVYTTPVIHGALSRMPATSNAVASYRVNLEEGVFNDIDGILVKYFVVPHDATQTVGYAIDFCGYKFVIMTDIGQMTDEAVEFASKADTVVVESNFDVDMLLDGPYTPELKMRIIQGHGHLSNDNCAAAVRRFLHPGLKHIFLCHLSENNNTPTRAYNCVYAALKEACEAVSIPLPQLRCLPRRIPSPLMTL